MKDERSGRIYRFKLFANLGYAYCEIMDFSDIYLLMVKVYDYLEEDFILKPKISSVVENKILVPALIIFQLPRNKKGKKIWDYIGKNPNYSKDFPLFKHLDCAPIEVDWSKTGFGYKNPGSSLDEKIIRCDYEEVRHLPTRYYSHIDVVPDLTTMIYLLRMGIPVYEYFDIIDLGYRNEYIGIINTYLSKEDADEKIAELKQFMKENGIKEPRIFKG